MFDRRLWSRNLVLINLCSLFASFTNFAYIYILPVHVLGIGGSNAQVGLMGAGMMVIGLATRFIMSPMIDSRGRKPMLVLGTVLFALTSAGYYLFRDSVSGMIAMRCLSGFSQGIFFPVPPTCVTDNTPQEKLVDALGLFGISSALPAIFSPVLGLYLYEGIGANAFFLATWISTLFSVACALFYHEVYAPAPKPGAQRAAFRLGNVMELSVLMPCLVFFFGCFGFSAVNNFAIVYGEKLAIAGMSLFFTVHNLAIVLTRFVVGRLSALLSVRRLIVLGLMLCVVGILMVAAGAGLPMMLAGSVTIGIGGTVYSQYLQANVLLRVSEDRRGIANSTLMVFQDVGQGLGAATFGMTSEILGYQPTFVAASLIALLSVPFTLKDREIR